MRRHGISMTLVSFIILCQNLSLLPVLGREMNNVDIRSMIVGDKVLEYVQANPLTSRTEGSVSFFTISPDGKYVAYLISNSDYRSLRIAATSGEYTTSFDNREQNSAWVPQPKMAWSPDNSRLYVLAEQLIHSDDCITKQSRIFILDSQGKICNSYTAPSNYSFDNASWSPDNKKLAIIFAVYEGEAATIELLPHMVADYRGPCSLHVVIIVDSLLGASNEVYSKSNIADIIGWTEQGDALRCVVRQDSGEGKLVEIHLGKKTSRTLEEHYDYNDSIHEFRSKSGAYRIIDPYDQVYGIDIEVCNTRKILKVIKRKDAGFLDWTPLDPIFIYSTENSIIDDSGRKKRTFDSLWLASMDPSDSNHLLLAPEYNYCFPECSSDCTSIVYTFEGQLLVAKLRWRDIVEHGE